MKNRFSTFALCVMLILSMLPISAAAISENESASLDGPSILQANPYDAYDEKNAKKSSLMKIARSASLFPEEEATLSGLATSFIHAYHESITSKDETDLAAFYDLSTENRQLDYTLNQAYIRFRMHTNLRVVNSQETITQITFDWNAAGLSGQSDAVVVSALNSHIDTLDSGMDMEVYDQLHEITFARIGDAYKVIKARQYNFDFASLIDHYNDRPEFANDVNTFSNYMIGFADNFDAIKEAMPEVERIEALASRALPLNDYTQEMRNAAVAYAVKYSEKGKYNSKYPDYKDGKGNYDCTNFTSQCLWDSEGANFPSDRDGYTWYFNVNNWSDRSTSWAGAHAFREYLYYNDTSSVSKKGIVASTSLSYTAKNIQPGDIIQISRGTNSSSCDGYEWNHSLLCTYMEKNSSGTIIDAWFRCHDGEVANGLVSAYYGSAKQRGFWQIKGYN